MMALPRPRTGKWGSGVLLDRIEKIWGKMDVIFGKMDNVDGFTVDRNPEVNPSVVCDWADMPFEDRHFQQGYWDPPYIGWTDADKGIHYHRLEPCYREIQRIIARRLFILSPLVYPAPIGFKRVAVVGVTYGPNKIIRALQGFERERNLR